MTNIHEIKAKLSAYLDAVAAGDRVVICRRNRPVAELRAIAAAPDRPRPLGGARGRLAVPRAFFDPLPADLIEAFEAGAAVAAPRAAGRGPGRRRAPHRRKPAR